MGNRIRSFALILGVLGTGSAAGQSGRDVTTVPHPPSPSLTQIESEARRSVTGPRDRPATLTGAELRRMGALRAPHADDVQKFNEFLKLDDTGIIRLFPDADCVRKYLVRVDGDCTNHVPGASGMSFRGGSISDDLRFSMGDLVLDGFFSVGIIVDLGTVGLESVSPNSDGIGHLSTFGPAENLQDALRDYLIIRAGESRPPFRYSNRTPAVTGNTYAVRIIAFDADNIGIKRLGRDRFRAADWETRGKFSALRYDKRGDVLAVFQVVRRDEDGSLTILWKKLTHRKAPKLRFDRHQELKDFK